MAPPNEVYRLEAPGMLQKIDRCDAILEGAAWQYKHLLQGDSCIQLHAKSFIGQLLR